MTNKREREADGPVDAGPAFAQLPISNDVTCRKMISFKELGDEP